MNVSPRTGASHMFALEECAFDQDGAALPNEFVIEESTDALEFVASVPNDLNIVTLLNLMSPKEVAAKMARHDPGGWVRERLPPPIETPRPDVINIFRIDRRRIHPVADDASNRP